MNLCVSIKENNFELTLKKITDEKFVEIRLDELELSDSEFNQLFSNENNITTIATCRNGFYNECERKEILIKAILSGADFVDIEIEADANFKNDILKLAHENKCKVIISYHNYINTPSREELYEIIKNCNKNSDIIKIACMVNKPADKDLLLSLYKNVEIKKELLIIGMGEEGILSRVLALDYGAPFTFVSKNDGEETADGQISKDKFFKIYSYLNSKKIFAVTGNPILHSKSPIMFNSIFKDNLEGYRNTYLKLAADSAEEAISVFKNLGFNGMNVTAPFKKNIMKELDKIDNKAEKIGGVNTIIADYEGKLTGDNTDYIGVQNSLTGKNIDIGNKNIVVLGAGGASNGVIYALKDIENRTGNKANSIVIVNRTVSKAREIAIKFECSWSSTEELKSLLKETDILISTLSADIDMVKKDWLRKETVIFDANYKSSKLITIAEEIGTKTIIRGEQWLLYQAIPAYNLYTGGKISDIEVMKEALQLDMFQGKRNCISLIGAMGSGKTVIGKSLAEKLGFNFIDIDEEIVTKTGRSITDIFEADGEPEFRKIENLVLKDILDSIDSKKTIISCGGGIVLNEDNREMLKKNSICIWLYTNPEKVIERIGKTDKRPLLKGKDILETAKSIFEQRKFLYASTADMIILNDSIEVNGVVSKIIGEIERI